MKPTQLIIGDIYLPYASRDRYSCPEEPLVTQVQMISGRVVQEVRGGKVYRPHYEYDYLPDSIYRPLKAILASGQAFEAAVLPDDKDELVVSSYIVESFTQPTFAFARGGKPYWHNISFTLREVNPHD